MQRVPAAGRPAGDDRDDDLGHRADQPLHLEDVQPPARGRARAVDGVRGLAVGVLVAAAAADPLVAAGAERPAAVLGATGRCRSAARSRRPASSGRGRATRYSSSTVCGRNALRTSGRSKAIRTVPGPGRHDAPGGR